jgi:hypothetical protein
MAQVAQCTLHGERAHTPAAEVCCRIFVDLTCAGGNTPQEACTLCPASTYSANIGTERCIPCGAGFTSPEGAGDESECYPAQVCPAGTGAQSSLLNRVGCPAEACATGSGMSRRRTDRGEGDGGGLGG